MQCSKNTNTASSLSIGPTLALSLSLVTLCLVSTPDSKQARKKENRLASRLAALFNSLLSTV